MAEIGALSLRIEESGGQAILTKLAQIDAAAKITGQNATPLGMYFKKAGDAAGAAGTSASQGAQRASGALTALNKEIATGTRLFALQARTVDVTSKTAVAELRASAAAQRQWLVSVGASTEQQERFNASVQRFEQRVARGGAVVAATTPKLRSGASALAALAIAATTGTGSLSGMATQAGLVGSVMAAEFAPSKWAGYAAGIGAVVVAATALFGIMKRLREEARKPREAIVDRIGAINLTAIAQSEADRLREERDALRKFVEDARETGLQSVFSGPLPKGVTQSDVAKRGASGVVKDAENRAAQLDAEFAIANKRLAELTTQSAVEQTEVAKAAIIQAAENTKTVRLSEIAKEQAEVEAAFQAGTVSLATQYEQRRQSILDAEQAEIAALRAARAQKLKPVAGETPQAAQQRQIDVGAIDAQLAALGTETAARLTALNAQRDAEERALAARVLTYQAQLEAFSDEAFARRMQQIAAEDAERRKVLGQRGDATAQELAELDALRAKQEASLFLQKAQADVARLRADLELRVKDIQNQRAQGLLTEEQSARAIADIQRSAMPSIREAVDRAIQWAEKLGNQGVLGVLKQIRAELEEPINLNIDISTDLITKRLNEAVDRIQKAVNQGILSAESGREMVRQAQFGAGIASGLAEAVGQGASAALQGKNPLEAFGNALSSSMGSLLVKIGTDWLAATAIMQTIQTALTTLNPWAAAAAAAALIVFGTALGGTGGSSGQVASGGFSGTSSTPLSVRRLIIDPNAAMRQRMSGAPMPAPAAMANPLEGVRFLITNGPDGERYLAERVRNYQRRGG